MTNEETVIQGDEQIVKLILNERKTELFEVLYDRYSKRVFNKCLGFVNMEKQAAEDLTHDIFLKTYVSLGSFSNKSKFSTWLFSITYNHCLDHVKKSKKNQQGVEDYSFEESSAGEFDGPGHSEDDLLQLQVDRLKLLMAQLPEEDKALLLLKYQDELSIKEIQSVTNLSESAIKMRLKRGRDRLLRMYENKYAHNVI